MDHAATSSSTNSDDYTHDEDVGGFFNIDSEFLGGLFPHDELDGEDVTLSSPSLPLVKDLVKRILRTNKLLKGALQKFDGSLATSDDSDVDALEKSEVFLKRCEALYSFLWGRLLRIIYEEHRKCDDVYVNTMNMDDHVPFESLVNAIHQNTVFCDALGELVDYSYDQKRFENEEEPLDQRVRVLKEHYKAMEPIQMTATHFAVLVVEGSRESFLDPVSMYDLCKTVVNENNRRKRLISLSLMFSTLDQDDQAIAEALIQGVPRVLLQRLRHLVHYTYGRPPEPTNCKEANSAYRHSPQRHQSAVVRSEPSSHLSSRRPSPQGTVRGPVRTSPFILPSQEICLVATQRGVSPPESPIPVPPDGAGTFPSTTPASTVPVDHRKRSRQQEDSLPVSSKTKCLEKCASSEGVCAFPFEVGDCIARGPHWSYEQQGDFCDYGKVIGFTDDSQVVVQWEPACDAPSNVQHERLYRYQYGGSPHIIVRWEEYLRVKTMTSDKDAMRKLESMLILALVGSLCRQKDTILPALQFQTIESILRIMDSICLSASQQAYETAAEQSEMREKQRVESNEGANAAIDEAALSSLLQWDPVLQKAKAKYRTDREWIVGAVWVLNAVITHKKLALLSLEAGGVQRILRIVGESSEMVVIHSCVTTLSHVAKTTIFEELLRQQSNLFEPIMRFIVDQWKCSPGTNVQVAAGEFLFHAMSFPCVLSFFDSVDGPAHIMSSLEANLTVSEEHFDTSRSNLQQSTLKCLNTYLISHLMLATKVIFRRHRVLSLLVTKSSVEVSLPRDPATVDAVLGFLSVQPQSPSSEISTENVHSLLTLDRLPTIQKLIGNGLHKLLLRCTNHYFIQSRWDMLSVSLQALCVLTVIPYVRPLIAEPQPLDSGVSQLLLIVNDMTASYNKNSTSREGHVLPCVVAALHILINVTAIPTDPSDEAAVITFNSICGVLRASDGVRTLLEALKIKRETSMSAKLNYFPVVARVVQLMSTLRHYGDTNMLFEALGVHRVAQELLTQYGDVQREYISMIGSRKMHTELDPAGRFMDNVKSLMSSTFGEVSQADMVKAYSADPLELEQRQAIISRAVIGYSKSSLLELIAQHLERQGFLGSAQCLRKEGDLKTRPEGQLMPYSDQKGSGGDPTLDSIVRTYLRQQQERCVNPIETLPQFDLTKKHVYLPPTVPIDQTRNVFDRLLQRRAGEKLSFRMDTNENFLTYRYPAFMFDITGGGEGIQGESLAFCDDGDAIIVGSSEGDIAFFDTFPEEVSENKLLESHSIFENESVSSLVVSCDGSLLAAVSESNIVKVMQRRALPVVQQQYSGARTARFSNDNKWILATCDEHHMCRLYDLSTQQELRCFSDRSGSGENMDNVAVFDNTSQLVLSDGILWDVRCSEKPVFRFDRITESFASTFHPSNQLVIIDEKVWDLRSLRMVQTVAAFQKTSSFHVNRCGKIIYSFREGDALSSSTSTPIISAVDAYSMGVIFSEEVRPAFKAFALDPSDRYCAALVDQDTDSMIRIRLFNMSSGPFSGHGVFTSHDVQEEEDPMEDDEDEGDWSLDSDFDGEYDDNDDDDISNTDYTSNTDYAGSRDDGEEEEEEEEEEDDNSEDAQGLRRRFHDYLMEHASDLEGEESDNSHSEEGSVHST